MLKRLQTIAEKARQCPTGPLDRELPELIERYAAISAINNRPHDPFIHACIEQAIIAGSQGSFAVGSVIVAGSGKVIERAPARVLQPYLRTDLHAEMSAITKLEEHHRFQSRQELESVLEGSMLFSSLEPCPMCFTRWILSGVKSVFYACPEPRSGMVEAADRLPAVWLDLIRDGGKRMGRADCSPELSDFCLELFVRSLRTGGGPQWQWK